MKYWREYYLAKRIEKHFGKINIGDLDKMQYNMTHVHYYWWIKYWRIFGKIANRQSLLLANISSYTVVSHSQTTFFFIFGWEKGSGERPI